MDGKRAALLRGCRRRKGTQMLRLSSPRLPRCDREPRPSKRMASSGSASIVSITYRRALPFCVSWLCSPRLIHDLLSLDVHTPFATWAGALLPAGPTLRIFFFFFFFFFYSVFPWWPMPRSLSGDGNSVCVSTPPDPGFVSRTRPLASLLFTRRNTTAATDDDSDVSSAGQRGWGAKNPPMRGGRFAAGRASPGPRLGESLFPPSPRPHGTNPPVPLLILMPYARRESEPWQNVKKPGRPVSRTRRANPAGLLRPSAPDRQAGSSVVCP
ncbi:hypothetical protein LX36DRAFT_475306 [Colletotrichum falcatum]|nr:hypothetical protein LX36DRAFT_475306 [Colletotrichum falcatum]